MKLQNLLSATVQNNTEEPKRPVKLRLYAMKGLYLLTFLTLGHSAWTELIYPSEVWQPLDGVAYSFWAAYATLMGLGIRYPIKLLPLLLLQLFYKSVWLIAVAYPLWSANLLDPSESGLFRAFAIGVILDTLVIPWRYAREAYTKRLFKFK
ncbi:MAG: hypothetical protein AAFO99_02465 [Bacteroidota bacterium]